MAKADKSDTSTEEEKAVEAKISDDVVDAEIIEETSEDTEAPAEEDLKTDDQADETEATEEEVPQEETSEAADDLVASDDGNSEETEDSSEEGTATSEETPVEAPVQPTQPTAAPVKKTGFLPVALGGVVAAALGFGLSQYVGPLSAEKDPALVALETLVAEQSQKIDELLAGQADAQTAIEAAQSSASSATSNVEGLTGAVAAVNSRIDDAAGALATLDGRLAALEKNPISQNLPSAALEAYEREVEELKAAVAQQRAEAASMEENAKLTAQQALARAALSRVLSALDSGTPYRVALTDFSAATGTAVSAALETYADDGVTSLASLQDSFPEVARKALAAARSGEQTGGVKLTDFFKAQLGARSVTPQEGDGADAVLSRAEGALRAGRVTDALAELSNLPEEAKPAFVDWIAQADARQAAFAAGEALSQQLNTN